MSTIAKLVARVELNTSGFDKGVTSMLVSMDRLKKDATILSSVVVGSLGNALRAGVIAIAAVTAASALASVALGKLLIDASMAAGRVSELAIVNQILAKNAGISGQVVIDETAAVRKMGIEAGVAQTIIAKFIQNKLDLTKADDLARIAQDAATISGQNSTQALDGLLQGLVTLQPEVLRTYGLFIDSQLTYQKFAKTLGITTDSLSTTQKQQALLNEVMLKGKDIQGAYEAAMKSPTKMIRSIPRYINDLVIALGAPFESALLTVVKGFTDLLKAWAKAFEVGGQLHDRLLQVAAVVIWLSRVFVALLMKISSFLGVTIDTAKSTTAVASSTEKTAGNIDDAAGSANTLANNVTKVSKAARGALAAFDELNVLSQSTDSGSLLPEVLPEDIAPLVFPAPDTSAIDATIADIEARVKEFGERVALFFKPVTDAWAWLVNFWNTIIAPWIVENPKLWLAIKIALVLVVIGLLALIAVLALAAVVIYVWTTAVTFAAAVMAIIASPVTLVILVIMLLIGAIIALIIWWPILSAAAAFAVEKIQMAWANLVAWFENTVINPFIAKVSPWWNFISIVAHDALVLIKYAWQTVTGWFSTNVTNPLKLLFLLAFGVIEGYVTAVWAKIKLVFGTVKEWLSTNIGEPIRNAFGSALDWVHAKWNAIFASIAIMTENYINGIITLLNGMLRGLVTLLNGLIDGANVFGSALPEWISIPNIATPSIPHLAEGGVIPANNQFAAILGDQKSGNNIEAPEDLIRQIVREETGKMQADIKIEFGGSLAALVRELKPYIDKENVRVGGSLIKSGVTTS